MAADYLSWSIDVMKSDGPKDRRVQVEKLDDAKKAGGKNSHKCTLILTEGDSAKPVAKAGLCALPPEARQYYGVFPIRGKILNVRNAKPLQIAENTELGNIKTILGLHNDDNFESLRYGRVMIMTDQDHDGSHIKGLLINIFHHFWPTLLRRSPSFLVVFITPIVKATNNNTKEVRPFYSMHEYKGWNKNLGDDATDWTTKYYKGLASNEPDEAKQYFKKFGSHVKNLVSKNYVEDDAAIELAFRGNREHINARRKWISNLQADTQLDWKKQEITISDFVNKELIFYSKTDLLRSIPSIDGLKLGQRKILFCAFKINLNRDTKVSVFASSVSEHATYQHGMPSVTSTIIHMAQDHVGSNNINLFQTIGQSGSRSLGGKDAADARYIDTKLSPATRLLFPKEDDDLLEYLEEDGKSIEPRWYLPIIPMVLVNGCRGIGTGWSSFIPNYNPIDIIHNLRLLLDEKPMVPMEPWYRRFKGTIKKTAKSTYTTCGTCTKLNDTTLNITELPIGRWTEDYKNYLQACGIEDIEDLSDESNVELILKTPKQDGSRRKKLNGNLEKKFKLTSKVSTTNMRLYDEQANLKKYDSPEQILKDYYDFRLPFYERRRKHRRLTLTNELDEVDHQINLIHEFQTEAQIEEDEIVQNILGRKRARLQTEGALEDLDSQVLNCVSAEKLQACVLEKARLKSLIQGLPTTPKLWFADLSSLEEALLDQ